MTVVSIKADSGDIAGRWRMDPERAEKADYLLDENTGKVYTFDGVSNKDAGGRAAFKGLKEETSSSVINNIHEKVKTDRVQGDQYPVHYHDI
ncbi:MAG: hypothetical protein J6J11_09540 [Treponema sp.]|nr:hypothetical protein [Treponema sp.]